MKPPRALSIEHLDEPSIYTSFRGGGVVGMDERPMILDPLRCARSRKLFRLAMVRVESYANKFDLATSFALAPSAPAASFRRGFQQFANFSVVDKYIFPLWLAVVAPFFIVLEVRKQFRRVSPRQRERERVDAGNRARKVSLLAKLFCAPTRFFTVRNVDVPRPFFVCDAAHVPH